MPIEQTWTYMSKERLTDGSEKYKYNLRNYPTNGHIEEASLEGQLDPGHCLIPTKMTIHYKNGLVLTKTGIFEQSSTDSFLYHLQNGCMIKQYPNGKKEKLEGIFGVDFFEGEIEKHEVDKRTTLKGRFTLKAREVDIDAVTSNMEKCIYLVVNGIATLVEKYSGSFESGVANGEGEALLFSSTQQGHKITIRSTGFFRHNKLIHGKKEVINSMTKTLMIEKGTFEKECLHGELTEESSLSREELKEGVQVVLEQGSFRAGQLVQGMRKKKEEKGSSYYIGCFNDQGEYEDDRGILWDKRLDGNRLYFKLRGGQPLTPTNYYRLTIVNRVLESIESIFHQSISAIECSPTLIHCLSRGIDGCFQEKHYHQNAVRILPVPDPQKIYTFKTIEMFLQEMKEVDNREEPTPVKKVLEPVFTKGLSTDQKVLLTQLGADERKAKARREEANVIKLIQKLRQSEEDKRQCIEQQEQRESGKIQARAKKVEQHILAREKGSRRRQNWLQQIKPRPNECHKSSEELTSPLKPGEIFLPNPRGIDFLHPTNLGKKRETTDLNPECFFWTASDPAPEQPPQTGKKDDLDDLDDLLYRDWSHFSVF